MSTIHWATLWCHPLKHLYNKFVNLSTISTSSTVKLLAILPPSRMLCLHWQNLLAWLHRKYSPDPDRSVGFTLQRSFLVTPCLPCPNTYPLRKFHQNPPTTFLVIIVIFYYVNKAAKHIIKSKLKYKILRQREREGQRKRDRQMVIKGWQHKWNISVLNGQVHHGWLIGPKNNIWILLEQYFL